MAEFINTVDVLGDDAVIDSLIERTITEFKDDKVTILGFGALAMCKELKNVDIPNVTTIQQEAIRGCDALETVYAPNAVSVGGAAFNDNIALQSICLPKAKTILANTFRQCYALEYVELPEVQSFGGYVFERDLALKAVVIRQANTVPTIAANTFHYIYGSGISKGTGRVYVPSALVDRYKVATNWSVYAEQIRALEDYTVDGTITGEVDPDMHQNLITDGLVFNLDLRGRTAENNHANPPTITDPVSGLACTTYNIEWDGKTSGFVDSGLLLKDPTTITGANQYNEKTVSVLGVPPLPDVDFANGITFELLVSGINERDTLCRFFACNINGTTKYLSIRPFHSGAYHAHAFVDVDGNYNACSYMEYTPTHYYSSIPDTLGEHLYTYVYSPDGMFSMYYDGKLLVTVDGNQHGIFKYFALYEGVKNMEANYIGSTESGIASRNMIVGGYRMYNRALSANEVKHNYLYVKDTTL